MATTAPLIRNYTKYQNANLIIKDLPCYDSNTNELLDLTNMEFKAEVRATVAAPNPVVTLTDVDGIVASTTASTITITVPEDMNTSGVWDVFAIDNTGIRYKLAGGTLTVQPSVTQFGA